MKLARTTFRIAGVLGLLLLVPLAYSAGVDRQSALSAISGAGLFFAGYVFQYLCWQVLYLAISTDPLRYRPIMIPAFVSQVIGVRSPLWLYLYGVRYWIPAVVVEAVLAILFLVAYWTTRGVRGREAA